LPAGQPERPPPITELEKLALAIFGAERTYVVPTLTEAIDKAVQDSVRPLSDQTLGILITGSVVTAGEARSAVRKKYSKSQKEEL